MTAEPPAPMLPEFPLAIGAGFLAMALGCSFSPSVDRDVLVGSCAAAGVLLVAVSIVMAWSGYSDPDTGW